MFIKDITPRFNDTDALGHINNTTVAVWFEEARRPIFELFNPDLDVKKWNLIIAKIEISYLKQMDYQSNFEIQTTFEKIGNSSMTIIQKVVMDDEVYAEGKAVMVHFDYKTNMSVPIPDTIKEKLSLHLK